MAQMARLGEVVALSHRDVDIPQFAWYTLGGTTVQLYAIYCDACDLPDTYKASQEWTWMRELGMLAGVLAVVLSRPALELRRRILASNSYSALATHLCCAQKKSRNR